MGEEKEEKKKEESKEGSGDQKKDENKKENNTSQEQGQGGGGGAESESKSSSAAADHPPPPPPEIILKVDMHCEACARKMARALKGFQGVEEVSTDCKSGKVVVKGKSADPVKVCERLQKKSGRKVELISPIPKPPEESKPDQDANEQNNKEAAKTEEKKEEPPAPITVVLSVRMHCEACAQGLRKRVQRFKGVDSAETDLSNGKVTVKGIFEPQVLVDYVKKKTGKQASIVKQEEEKKGEEEVKKKEEEGEKKEGTDQNNSKAAADAPQEEKKEGDGQDGIGDEDKNRTDIKRSEYWPSRYYMEYAYAPQIFSDENPNACSVM